MPADVMNEEEQLLGELLPLAMLRAHHYERMWHQGYGEFETAALMGAWDAIKRYDPTIGASLFTYARTRIDGEIIDWHRKEMTQKGGGRNHPPVTLCVDFNDVSRDDIGSLSEGAQIEHMYGRTSERGYSFIEDHDLLLHLKERMDAKEWDIMIRCICNEEYMKDVGKDYGVSESRICQILPVALRHARRIIDKMYEEIADLEDAAEHQWLRRLRSAEGSGA